MDALQELEGLLRTAKAVPRLRANAVTAPSIYDPLYRVIIIALAMRLCGKEKEGSTLLSGPRLKLFQFVAVHRELLPSLRGWIAAHAAGQRPSLDGWARFPRGYAADVLYERITTYLIAVGELRREGKELAGKLGGNGLLARCVAISESSDAFALEREALRELATLRITLRMLDA